MTCFIEELAKNVACKASTYNSAVIEVDPFTTTYTNTVLTIRVSGFINPPYSRNTDAFTTEVMLVDSKSAYLYMDKITGVTISAGSITGVAISGRPLNKNTLVPYNITFTTKNPIPSGGIITVAFPGGYSGIGTICTALSGISTSATC